MTDDEFDPLPADMMRARRRMTPGTYVHRRGIAKLEAVSGRIVHHIDGDPTNNRIDNLELRMTTAERIERLSEATHGGRFLRAYDYTREWSRETLSDAARMMVRGSARTTPLPETAFDWPIYRIAMLDCALEGTNYALPGGTLAVHGLGQWTWSGHRDPLYVE